MKHAIMNNSKLSFYSPVNFIRDISAEKHISFVESTKLDCLASKISIEGEDHVFYYKNLSWDSTFFKLNTIKLNFVIYDHNNIKILNDAINKFLTGLEYEYCFIEIPSEDILLIQALNLSQFRLVETRLSYYHDRLEEHQVDRYKVRTAVKNDIPTLKEVAMQMRNEYDRFHADPFIAEEHADVYLATYIENSINGFSDCVLVPDEAGLPSKSFLTANFQKNIWDLFEKKISKLVLSAVHTENKGWYYKLISEMMYFLRDQTGSEILCLNTQSTNRAVLHTWNKLGFKFGATTHILVKKCSI